MNNGITGGKAAESSAAGEGQRRSAAGGEAVIGRGKNQVIGQQDDRAEKCRQRGHHGGGDGGAYLTVDEERDGALVVVIISVMVNGPVQRGAGGHGGDEKNLEREPRGQGAGGKTAGNQQRPGEGRLQRFQLALCVLQSVCKIGANV